MLSYITRYLLLGEGPRKCPFEVKAPSKQVKILTPETPLSQGVQEKPWSKHTPVASAISSTSSRSWRRMPGWFNSPKRLSPSKPGFSTACTHFGGTLGKLWLREAFRTARGLTWRLSASANCHRCFMTF
jgi:hypothetical protein